MSTGLCARVYCGTHTVLNLKLSTSIHLMVEVTPIVVPFIRWDLTWQAYFSPNLTSPTSKFSTGREAKMTTELLLSIIPNIDKKCKLNLVGGNPIFESIT